MRGRPSNEKLLIGGDFNGHTGSSLRFLWQCTWRLWFGDRNEGGVSLLDIAIAFALLVAIRVPEEGGSLDYLPLVAKT